MSTAEAEYVALSASCAQVMWMRTQLKDYGFNYNKIPLYCDSQSAIAISCNPVQHSRTMHINFHYHLIKEQVERGIIELYFVRTEYQLADLFTKAFWQDMFEYLVRRLGNSQVKDNKIDLLVQQYEQFVISEDESIDSAFARFNTIITSLKALDEGYSSKNYVRKFLRALHPKWRAKVTTIEESKDLTSLSLDELIGNLKVHEMIIKKDSKIVKAKGERKSLALKAKKESSDEECSTFGSEDEWQLETSRSSSREENGKSDRKCFRCGDPNHLIGECPKPPKDKNQRAFVGGSWSNSGEEDDEKAKDETCLVNQV
ncbi:zf-CCHC domain-containing protein [Tanacetum coccineum]